MFYRNVVITLLLLISFTTATAQDCIDYSDYLHLEDSILIPGDYCYSNDMIAHGDILYIATRPHGIITAQITPDDKIVIRNTTPTWSTPEAIIRLNDQLLVADGNAGLIIYDISNPLAPEWLAHIDTPGYALDIEAITDRTFILDHYMGLVVIDNHEVRSPRIVATLSLPGEVKQMTRQGDLMFIACGAGGLVVVSIADPDNPLLLQTYDLSGEVMSVASQDNQLALLLRGSALKLYTIKSPENLQFTGSIPTYQTSDARLLFHDGLLLFGSAHYELSIINTDDPAAPFVQGKFHSRNYKPTFAVTGNRLVAASDYIELVDFSNPITPPTLSYADVPGPNNHIAIHGDFAYVASTTHGLRVVDFQDIAAPSVTVFELSEVRGDIAVRGDYLYVSGITSDIDIYSLSDPSAPEYHSSFEGAGDAIQLDFHDNIMIVVSYSGFALYDMSIPTAPHIFAYHPVNGSSQAAIQGNYMYLAARYQGGLQVWDMTNPATIHRVATFTSPGLSPRGVIPDGDFLYVSSDQHDNGFLVFDISDPTDLLQVASLPLNFDLAPGIMVDKTIYWGSDRPVQVIGVHDPLNPQYLGATGLESYYTDLAVNDQRLFALGRNYGITVAPLQCSPLSSAESPASFAGLDILDIYPNPFNPQTTIRWVNDNPRHLKMSVYDLAGRRVATLADRVFESGPCSVNWNGTSDNGQTLPSGIFLVTLKGQNINTSRRISLVR